MYGKSNMETYITICKIDCQQKCVVWLRKVPEESKIEKGTCIPFFIAALFTIARTWKQPRCPSTDEWIKKLWYIYTMEYYSVI